MQILELLFGRKSVPQLGSLFVSPRVIHLAETVQEYVEHADAHENAITATIYTLQSALLTSCVRGLTQRFVICLVDVRVDYSLELDGHVVQSGANGSRPHGIGVAAAPADLQRMRRRVRQEYRD
jgi:hypothetical protein